MTRGMQAGRQTTLREQVAVTGIGVHSGWPATVTLHPAQTDTGIVFVRCASGGEKDRELPATTSTTIISQVIRGFIGFDGLLMSDDLSMGALSGSLAERTTCLKLSPGVAGRL